MTKRRRSRRLVVLVTAIMVVLTAEAVLVAFVFISPRASDQLQGVAAAVSRVWSGTKGSPGIRTKVADAFHRGYQDWIVPLWSSQATPSGNPTFTECVKCHRDYATKRKFSSVYMNHPEHAQLGVACATCHTQNAHPSPPHPQEKVCATCHAEVNEQGKCGTCHPPGSLPHFYLLGAPRQQVAECSVCHPRKTFGAQATVPKVHLGDFSGGNKSLCLSCHQNATCLQCHQPPHPSNWVAIHGPIVGEDPTYCNACHPATWCSDRCHAVTSTNLPRPRPLPSAGVRP